MLCDVDFNTRVTGFEFPGHVLDDKDVPLLALCSLPCAIQWGLFMMVMRMMVMVVVMVMRALRLLFRIRAEDIDSHEAAWSCLITYEIKVEQDLVAGKGLVDCDSPSALNTRAP